MSACRRLSRHQGEEADRPFHCPARPSRRRSGRDRRGWCGTATRPIATITLTAYVDVDGPTWKPDRDPEALSYPEDDPADALYAAKMMIPLAHAGAKNLALSCWTGPAAERTRRG